MPFVPPLSIGQSITNQQLQAIFRCSNMGGMRRSSRTDSLVLVSDHTQSIYEDRWVGEQLHYTGMGLKGDQQLDRQNRTLQQSPDTGVALFLFEMFLPNQYTYRGPVKLAEEPYQQEQKDQDGRVRKVWVFPLLLMDQQPIAGKRLEDNARYRGRRVRRLRDDELRQLAQQTQRAHPPKRRAVVDRYMSSVYICEYVKRRAQGICELCGKPAPFCDPEGRPYLECYHVLPLAQDGPDTLENMVALCPNCRAQMQVLAREEDLVHLRARLCQRPIH